MNHGRFTQTRVSQKATVYEVSTLPEIVTGQRDVSSVISTSTEHEPARGRLQFASGIVVAGSDFLAVRLQVAAAR